MGVQASLTGVGDLPTRWVVIRYSTQMGAQEQRFHHKFLPLHRLAHNQQDMLFVDVVKVNAVVYLSYLHLLFLFYRGFSDFEGFEGFVEVVLAPAESEYANGNLSFFVCPVRQSIQSAVLQKVHEQPGCWRSILFQGYLSFFSFPTTDIRSEIYNKEYEKRNL